MSGDCLFKKGLKLIMIISLMLISLGTSVSASSKRDVKVAFFPMDGFHIKNDAGEYSGVDVDYLQEVAKHANWNVIYVECDSWQHALELLENKDVDLVGSAQFSESRAQIFDYADLSSGYTFGVLATNPTNNIAYEDFNSMSNMYFGIVENYVRKDEFLAYLAENGITNPVIKEYPTTADLQKALDEGEIDIYAHTFTEMESGQRLIGRFTPRPFYYITYKGNDAVLKELNLAITDLKMSKPELENDLMNKYYLDKLDKTVLFTLEEKQYLRELDFLLVGYVDGHYPLTYEYEGEFAGLTRMELDALSKEIGVEFVYVKYDSTQAANSALLAGEIDFLSYFSTTYDDEDNNNYILIDEYVEVPLVMVMNSERQNNEINSLAVKGEIFESVDKVIDINEENVIQCLMHKDTIALVSDGSVDAALCDGYIAEELIRTNSNYDNVEITKVISSSYFIHMALRKDADYALVNVLKKTTFDITSQEINEFMLERNQYLSINFDQIMVKYGLYVILFLTILIFGIVAVGIQKIKDSNRIQKLMYKDMTLDIWNMNYLVYFGEKNYLKEYDGRYSVVSINILQFKRYNVVFGWDLGQKILNKVCECLKEIIDEEFEICARIHGDRFILLLKWRDWHEFEDRLFKIQTKVENALFELVDNHMAIQMGVYPIPKGHTSLRNAVNYANQALESLRTSNENSIKFFDKDFEEQIKERHAVESLLESVDIYENFTVFYQNKVDIRNEAIVGAEALIRFIDPSANGAIRAPGYFINYYEETGRIVELDFFVLESVCDFLRRRIDEGKKIVPISCNFSRIHFIKEGFIDRLEHVFNKYDISKDLVEIEITETLLVKGLEEKRAIKDTVDHMITSGFKLAIDDFGAGYSSLAILEQIPASVVKMDRAFLLNREDRERQIKIMQGIVKMSNDLNASIVCEGVEDQTDVDLMKEINAYVAQGYYFSKPSSEDDFVKQLDI